MPSTMIRVRMDSALKAQTDAALASMGLNMSVAVNAMARQILHQGKLPFELYVGNPDLLEAMREAEDIRKHPENHPSYTSAHEMMEDVSHHSDGAVPQRGEACGEAGAAHGTAGVCH